MSTSNLSYLSALVNGVGSLAVLAAEIALLVVVLTTVRRNRPQAMGTLLASAIISIAGTVFAPIAYPLAAAAIERSEGGFERISLLYAMIGVGFSLLHTLALVLLVVGVVRLASPERTPMAR